MYRSAFSIVLLVLSACVAGCQQRDESDTIILRLSHDETAQTLSVFRSAGAEPILVQNAAADHRPFLHPIRTPDHQSVVTEYSPGHHPHQTGLYWGFTRLNGRDYFHNPREDYWRRRDAQVIEAEGEVVRWETTYDLLDEGGAPVLTETQQWFMTVEDDAYVLDLIWRGLAQVDVTIGEYDYGGLFLRMPWVPGIPGQAVNAARQRNRLAEGKRAMWLEVGMQLEGRNDFAHMAIFDHPGNDGFPQPWRVDGQLGVGPVRARLGDWHIPQGTEATIRHRILVYTGTVDDVTMRTRWEAYAGREGATYSMSSLWGIAQQEAMEAAYLSPDEAAAAMTLPEGYEVTAWAGEPLLTQPMAFAWDDRGRLWVAENRDYESRQTGFSNSGDSRIVILEDTDRDGKADVRTVFLEGIAFPAALAVGFDGVFIGAPPHLLFVPDRNQDDQADVEDIQVLLTGWGIRDRHETINSLHWGPDGWLYGLEGFATASKIRKPLPGATMYRRGDIFPADLLEADGVDIDGGVWRYHPVKERFEVVAHGFSNPWGVDYDAYGQLFISACVIPHLFHVIPGGIYQRQGGRHFNPYIYQDIQHIVDHRHRSAHGGARIYQSDAFPAREQGRLFMANIHEHAVLSDVLEVNGSGFVARHGDDFLLANNAQWVGFSMEIGPEGGLYVLDWHDADICGADVHDKDTGRIFRIVPTASEAEHWEGRYDDLRTFSDLALARLQESPSDWHARRARIILQHRATTEAIAPDAVALLNQLFDRAPAVPVRLKAMWALHVTGQLSQERLLEATKDSQEYVRSWAIQLLLEDHEVGESLHGQLLRMASSERSPVVRKYLASGLQRMALPHRLPLATALVKHEADADDPNIPILLWTGLEPLVASDPEGVLQVARASRIPLVTQFIARRLVDADQTDDLVQALVTQRRARPALLEGMLAGLESRRNVQRPAGWDEAEARLSRDRHAAVLAERVSQSFNDTEAAQEALTTLLQQDVSLQERSTALQLLARNQRQELLEVLPDLLEDADLLVDAIRAMAAFDHEPLGEQLLETYPTLSEEARTEAIQALASRPVYGWLLTKAIQEGNIARTDVAPHVARQLRRVVGSGFVEVWGPIDQLSENKQSLDAQYRSLLTPEAIRHAEVSHGRLVYDQVCGACHKMYDAGGDVGPDLTGSNRTSLDYILSNVISPQEEIQEDYRMVIVTMRDGRTHIGSIASQSEHTLTLRRVAQPPVALLFSDIQSTEVSNMSLMPEGLFEPLSDDQIIDLVAYLNTTAQVPLPPS